MVTASHTPGPNNIMLLQSNALFGYRRTLPHILGVITGFCTLVFVISIGIASLLETVPTVLLLLKVVGTMYFFWFAYNILTMDIETIYNQTRVSSQESTQSSKANAESGKLKKRTKPFTFFQAFFFQWINIKAVLFSISIINLIPKTGNAFAPLAVLIMTLCISISATHLWSLMGIILHRFIKKKKTIAIINTALGCFLLWFCIKIWI